jgi:PhoH-like protein
VRCWRGRHFPFQWAERDGLAAFKQNVAREEPESKHFSASLHKHMAEFQHHIETLTREQYRVIRQLGPNRRVRIIGCAGSGKTLVAAEKAIRLGAAGLRTLVLCHNPLLAKHIAGLTQGSSVAVWAFGDWVRTLTSTPAETAVGLWTNYDEPEQRALEAAFDILGKSHDGFDAIIVDEGQDFRPEWWVVVEAALAAPESGILYIFHDDHQSLLPHRSSYPVVEPVLDLSRNCRNSGRVFNLVRYFHPQAPETELPLESIGCVWLECVPVGQEIAGLRRVLKQMSTARLELWPEVGDGVTG